VAVGFVHVHWHRDAGAIDIGAHGHAVACRDA
jgi:hypothetical protein